MTTQREVEAKWRVHPPFVVPPLAGEHTGVASVDPAQQAELRAVYWDTSDLRLAREGVTLRHRAGEGSKDGWHLKLPVDEAGVPDASTGVRDELHASGPEDAVPLELRELITARVRTAVLGPVATLVTHRTTHKLRGEGGNVLAELTDDLVSVVSSGHVAGRFREIEIELVDGEPDVLARVGEVLRAQGAVGGEFVPKVVRALGPQATAEPDPPRPERVTGRQPSHVAIRSILRRYVRLLLAADLAMRRGGEDAVHQMRVSARRLRSALKTFEPLLDPMWAESLREELAWLADSLGQARDSEVQLERLRADLDRLPEHLRIGDIDDRLTKSLGANLAAGAEASAATMNSERYVVLLERMVDAAWEPLTTPLADEASSEVLPTLMEAAWEKLARRAAALKRAEAGNEDWHKARIAAKRVRYAAEALAPIYGKEAKDFGKRIAGLQELLGEHQDAVVAADTLLELATAGRIGSVAFTLGLLHARQQEAMRQARADFPAAWAEVRRPKYRKWLTP